MSSKWGYKVYWLSISNVFNCKYQTERQFFSVLFAQITTLTLNSINVQCVTYIMIVSKCKTITTESKLETSEKGKVQRCFSLGPADLWDVVMFCQFVQVSVKILGKGKHKPMFKLNGGLKVWALKNRDRGFFLPVKVPELQTACQVKHCPLVGENKNTIKNVPTIQILPQLCVCEFWMPCSKSFPFAKRKRGYN